MSYKQTLLDLINKDNKTDFKLEDLKFSPPRPVTPGEGDNRNTKVDCYGVEASGFAGKFPFTFERLSLVKLFTGRTPVAEVHGGFYTLEEVILSLGERFAITLYPEDFTSPDIDGLSPTVTIVPNADSYYWLPTPLVVEVVVKAVDISTTLPHVQLPGFVYPVIA